jgi:gp16 family phage-associated protein
MKLQTPQQARQWFRDHGISISQWCRDNNVSRHTVNDLLRGKQHGYYGDSHRVAVLLRLKQAPTATYHNEKAA